MGDGRKLVMVVDDDGAWREALLELLALEGMSAVGAADGEEALRRLREGPRPDALVLDLSMPVLSGWQFRDAQLEDPALAGIPVAVVSADEPGRARPDRYLRKPCDPDALLAALRELTRAAA